MTGMQEALISGIGNLKKKVQEDAIKLVSDGKALVKNGVVIYLNNSFT